jgi:hypothetical protein
MRKALKPLALLLLAAVALYVYLDWTEDRRSGALLSDLRLRPIESQGQPGEAGNLLAIEARLLPADYQSRERLRLKFATYLEQAREAGLLNERSVVVLPEHVGTGLFAVGEKPEVQQARTLRDAMQWTALSNPREYLRRLFDNPGDDRRTQSVLRIKARRMAADYQQIFSGLARDYGVTLVAGSIVLPEPYLQDGQLRTGDGPLRQVSLSFDSQGRALGPLHYKHSLTRYERRYSEAPATVSGALLPTPAGRLAVFIGCDAHLQPLPPEAQGVLMIGAPVDPASDCPVEPAPLGELPRMDVQTLGLPWNLVGSPRQPARHNQGTPVQLKNLWLEPRR